MTSDSDTPRRVATISPAMIEVQIHCSGWAPGAMANAGAKGRAKIPTIKPATM